MTESTVREPQPRPKKNRKKRIIILAAAVVVLAAALLLIPRLLSGRQQADLDAAEAVFVDVPSVNYYNGVIEPRQTWDIQRDAERNIAQIYVSVGQSVTQGQQLFAYETDSLSMQLKQAQLEYNGIQNEIDGYSSQISELTSQREQAGADQQLDYTIQIQEMQSARSQSELDLQMKQMEIDSLQKSINNAVVTSIMDGVVKQINRNSSEPNQPFMTVLASGAYQVKGTVDENNVWTLSEGMAVNVRSRVDKDRVWSGTITKIDTENTVQTTTQDMYYGGSSENQATKYYFYVALDTDEQLLLGQHVYIEPLYGEGTGDVPEAGAAGEDAAAGEVPDAGAADGQ